jgi:DNA polymerase/3'-5' exonuclease PolX
MELSKARNIAEKLLLDISPYCSRAEIAGSIRRKKAEVKDVELVVRVENWDELFDTLQQHGKFIKPGVPVVTPWDPKPDAKYLRMLLNDDIKLDLFVASPENWGALYMMRTGSAAGPNGDFGFVPAMFAAWKRKSGGGKMVGCLPTTPEGLSISVPEEEDFFKLCGIKWVEPEERTSSRAVKKV